MASNPPLGTVASRMQVFQDRQGVRSTRLAGQAPTSRQKAEVDVAKGRVRRTGTAFTSPTYPTSKEGNRDIQYNGRRTDDTVGHHLSIGGTGDTRSPARGLSARPSTSFESRSSYVPLNLSGLPKQSREKCNAQRRQSSLDTQSTMEQRLSEARARLKPIGEKTAQSPDGPPRSTTVSPGQRRADIDQLHDLVDFATDEQVKLDIPASTGQSPHLEPIASQVETSMTNPTDKQADEMASSGSPLRRGSNFRSTTRHGSSAPVRTDLGRQHAGDSSFSPTKHTSPTGKRRLSTESVLPRSSIDSEPPATSAYLSAYSSPDMKPRQGNLHLHPLLPDCRMPSPVKDRRAPFEKMMPRDKQVMNQQLYQPARDFHVKKHCWLDPPDPKQTLDKEGQVKPRSISQTTKASRMTRRNSPTSGWAAAPAPKPAPIPLALPHLVSSRGRDVSASSQSEDSFEIAPRSEAALSRLSSRVYPPRLVPKAVVAQGTGDQTNSPSLRWKHFTPDKATSAYNAARIPPRDSSAEADAGEVLERVGDTNSDPPQLQSEDLPEVANQVTSVNRDDEQNPTNFGARAKKFRQDSPPRRSFRERDQVEAMTPKRQTVRCNAPRKRDQMSVDAVTNFAKVKEDGGAGAHRLEASTDDRRSSVTIEADQGKKVTNVQSDRSTEELGGRTIGSGVDVWSPQRQSQKSTPFPLMPVEASGAASVSAPGSPVRGRAFSRTLRRQRQSTITNNGSERSCVGLSRSRSKPGNVRVTVEVRTPQESPEKGIGKWQGRGRASEGANAHKSSNGNGSGSGGGERVVIVTTDVQEDRADEEKEEEEEEEE